MLGFTPIAATPLGTPSANEAFSLQAQTGIYALSMQGAAKLITDVYPSGTFLVNGREAVLTAQRPVNVDTGSFTYTGHDVIFDQGYGIVVPSGTFTLTGQDAIFDTGFGVIWRKGEYTVTGQSINIDISMNAQSGAFAVMGRDALKGVSEAFERGSFYTSFKDATITAQFHIRTDTGNIGTVKGEDIKIRGFLSAYVPPEIWTEVA